MSPLTNASNTRTYNLSWRRIGEGPEGSTAEAAPLPLKVVATDVGRFEREERVESVVLAPAQRYVVDVRFPEAGRWELVNHVHGINHRMGVFLHERSVMGTVDVSAESAVPNLTADFETLRTHHDVVADIDRYRHLFDGPIDHELVMTLGGGALPAAIRESMQWDWVYTHPVEWTGTMSHMNWASNARDARWTIREPATGRENRAIDWPFRVGDVVKIRVHNDRSAIHVMQHPLHIHGQRFLVVSQDGVPTENLAWKDTVLLPTGSTTDLLLELSNPGRWMVHCHIAEHLEAGMTFVFEVEGGP
ncbi:MAG: multicopper oxidase domain-containing protein [Longimicrobiales bacterium]